MYLAKASESLRTNGGDASAIEVLERVLRGRDPQHPLGRAGPRGAAQPSHLQALVDFAERAYRRPLQRAERDDLLAFYRVAAQRAAAWTTRRRCATRSPAC